MRTAYDILGLPPDADQEEIRAAYLALAKQLHPDRNADDAAAAAQFQAIGAAFETIRDPDRRRAYDRDLANARRPPRPHLRAAILGGALVVVPTAIVVASLAGLFLLSTPREEVDEEPLFAALETGSVAPTPTFLARVPDLPDPVDVRPVPAPASLAVALPEPAPAARTPTALPVPDALPDAVRAAEADPDARMPDRRRFGRVWRTHRDARADFALDYPADLLSRGREGTGRARLLLSADGRVRLTIVSGPTPAGLTPAAHQASLIAGRHRGATITYAPLRRTWHVVAGRQGATMFYERTTFSCDGATVHSWRVTYPTVERPRFLDVIARMHASYRHPRCPRTPTASASAGRPDRGG
jgi:hypothetical protein